MAQVARTPSDAVDALFRAAAVLFPVGAYATFVDGKAEPGPAFDVEMLSVQHAVASRQREFALGRSCARAALAQAGLAAAAIPAADDRSPVWPGGFVGSITHCAGFVGAVVARRAQVDAIGFDVEPAVPLDTDVVPVVCTASEIHWMKSAPRAPAGDWAKVLFSAKESIHKCIAPQSGVMLDFRDVTLTPSLEKGTFTAQLVDGTRASVPRFERIVGRFVATADFIATTAFIPAPGERA